MRMLFSLYVKVTDVNRVESAKGLWQQICFDGEATGEYFNGTVLPGGVDTQQFDSNGVGGLSARYILKGQDYTGTDCMIYVENTKASDEEYTHPILRTDSEALKWVEDADLFGKMVFEQDKLFIEVYER